MRLLTLRGWIVVIVVGALSAALSLAVCLQIRHWLQDEAQLHQIVDLIQRGQIVVRPGPPPSATPEKKPE